MARFRAPGMDTGRGVRFHQRELQCRRGVEPAKAAAEAPSADHERRRIAGGARFHHALLRHEFRHPQGPHPSRGRKGADRSSQANGPLARPRNADLDPRLRRLPGEREGGQGLSQPLRRREGRLGGRRQSPEDFRAAQSNSGRQDARRTQGAFHRRSWRLPAGGNGGTDRRRARQARRYRGRRLPDLLGQIQGRARAVERGGSSADGAGGIARAVRAGADAARRGDAVARGRRGGGLRGIPTMRCAVAALACVSLLALIAAPCGRAAADEPYPSKPIRFVLPQPAGGAVDLIARALGDRLSYAMRQPVIVENQPGANGGLAAAQVARAAPDGYTLFMAVDTNLVVNPNLYPNLAYDPLRDFIPISIIAKVSYRGTAPAMTDIAAGVVDVMFTGPPSAMALAAGGKGKILAVASPSRLSLMPQVPTMQEAGVPGYELSGWFGLLAPAKTPQHVVDRLASEVKTAVADGRFKDRLGEQGLDVFGSSSAEMLAVMTADTKKWSEVIAATGAKVPQ